MKAYNKDPGFLLKEYSKQYDRDNKAAAIAKTAIHLNESATAITSAYMIA